MPPVPRDQTSPFETRAGSRRPVASGPAPKQSPHSEPGSARAPPVVAPLPPYVPVKQACVVGGFGRSTLYNVVGKGLVRAVKLGTKTLIDTASLLKYLETLPAAQIRPAKPAKKRTPPATGNLPEAGCVASPPSLRARRPPPTPGHPNPLTSEASTRQDDDGG
jgi:excisionase family DNA binding protein